jgi:ATP-dependent DNA helicase RecG
LAQRVGARAQGRAAAARDRLAYDELLANSLALMLVRADNRRRRGQPLRATAGCAASSRCRFL